MEMSLLLKLGLMTRLASGSCKEGTYDRNGTAGPYSSSFHQHCCRTVQAVPSGLPALAFSLLGCAFSVKDMQLTLSRQQVCFYAVIV